MREDARIDDRGFKLKVAGCQLPDLRNDPAMAVATVRAYTIEAQEQGADLVAFPECFLQGYDVSSSHVAETALDLSGAPFSSVLTELRELEAVIVLGLIERDVHGYYNSAVVLKQGRLLARYRKRHLTQRERTVFRAGHEMPVVEVAGLRVAVNICYDLQFSEAALAAARGGAQVLACPCNNMFRREAAEQWKAKHNEIRSARAREAGLWLVSSDVTGERGERISYGPTAVIDPAGEIRARVPLLTEGIAVWEIDG